ncbi:MAG: hypothetical protein KDA17_05220 [Candidatus Saccharibacteria bacterium]|nr:hypothetical protein [Candidatus Saccharibacteria bacterium]
MAFRRIGRAMDEIGEALRARDTVVFPPTIDVESIREVAILRAKPEFEAFIASGGLTRVVDDARAKMAVWEEQGLLEAARTSKKLKQ